MALDVILSHPHARSEPNALSTQAFASPATLTTVAAAAHLRRWARGAPAGAPAAGCLRDGSAARAVGGALELAGAPLSVGRTLRTGLVAPCPPALVLHMLTFSANSSEHLVSCELSDSGPTLTSMSVLPSPRKHFCSRCVSLELR